MERFRDHLVIIDMTGPSACLTSPFKASPVIKRLFWRDRKWDAQRHVWWVELACVDALIVDLVAAGFEVDVHDGTGMHQNVRRAPQGRPA